MLSRKKLIHEKNKKNHTIEKLTKWYNLNKIYSFNTNQTIFYTIELAFEND